jgi:hypothetical protein
LLPHPHDKKKGEMVMRQSRTVGRDSVEP